jgi:hypothetical protein
LTLQKTKKANVEYENGLHEQAYASFMKACSIFIEVFPKHHEYTPSFKKDRTYTELAKVIHFQHHYVPYILYLMEIALKESKRDFGFSQDFKGKSKLSIHTTENITSSNTFPSLSTSKTIKIGLSLQ